MRGIRFVTDDNGRKGTAAVSIRTYGQQLEDFCDRAISEKRRKEKGIPLAAINAALIKRGHRRD